MTELLILEKMTGQYGLLPKRWFRQLEAIRALPESATPGSPQPSAAVSP